MLCFESLSGSSRPNTSNLSPHLISEAPSLNHNTQTLSPGPEPKPEALNLLQGAEIGADLVGEMSDNKLDEDRPGIKVLGLRVQGLGFRL